MSFFEILGLILIGIGLIFSAFGVYGLFKLKNFYARATIASLIDTAGFLFIAIGMIAYKGISTFSLKTLFLIILVFLLNPLANHYIVRGAHNSGLRITKEN